jgi:hypothetical protein
VKAIICARGEVEIFSFTHEWTKCPCGFVAARWTDGQRGIMQAAVKYPSDKEKVRLLGLNNQLLVRALTTPGQMWEDYRAWHDLATDAPHHIFDKSRAGCWAVIALIGSTSDTSWVSEEECKVIFGP